MGITITFLAIFLAGSAAHGDATRCEKLRAEAGELQKSTPRACAESRETHSLYVKSFPEVLEICRRLEADVAAGPSTLKLGSENEMQAEAVELRKKHMTERRELTERIAHELLRTPLDNDDPTRLPPVVHSECGSEVEAYARYRRSVLRGLSEFYQKIEAMDDTLFQQAQERVVPKNSRTPAAEAPRIVR